MDLSVTCERWPKKGKLWARVVVVRDLPRQVEHLIPVQAEYVRNRKRPLITVYRYTPLSQAIGVPIYNACNLFIQPLRRSGCQAPTSKEREVSRKQWAVRPRGFATPVSKFPFCV